MDTQTPQSLSELAHLRKRVKDLEMQHFTQLRQVENKLNENEAVLKAILDASTETISLTDSSGIILIANKAMTSILQKPVEEIVGRSLFDIFPHDIAQKRMVFIQQVVETGKPVSFLDQREHFSFESHLYPVLDETGRISRVAVFARDITQRVRAETALTKSQSLLNATQELAHIGGWEWDIAAQAMFWTDETYRIHGVTPDELPPGSPEHIHQSLNCYNPEDRTAVQEAFRRCAEQGQPYDLQFPFTSADGRRLWIRTMGKPVWNQEQIVKVIGNIVDITYQKQMENLIMARLRISEAASALSMDELLRKALDEAEALTGSCIGFFHFLEKDQQTISLQTWSSHTHRSLCNSDKTGHHTHVDAAGVWVDCIRQRCPVIHNAYAELPHRKGLPVGHVLVIRDLVVPVFRNEQIVAVFGVGNKGREYDQRDIELVSTLSDMIWDIVLRKQEEDSLILSEKRFRTVARLSSDFAYSCCDAGDGEYVVDWITDTFYTMTGISEAELKDIRCWMTLAHPDDGEIATEPLRRLQPGGCDTREFRIIAKDGRVLTVSNHMECEANPAAPGCLRIYGSVQDITERKRMEAEKAEIEAQNWQLHKAESLGRMAGAIAHNFNNQLQIVIGNLELAMIDPQGSSKTLSEAMKAARKASEISVMMAAYRGQLPGKREFIDLTATCRQNLALLEAAAPKGMILKTDFPASGGPVIRANASLIIQVLTNLVTNAWEAADKNQSAICLTVKTVSHTDIPAFKRFPAGWKPQESVYACVEVADSGSGIAYKDIEKLFDPFFSTKFIGRGMGLSVVLGVVNAHNGVITVESRLDSGSVFRVFLPVSTEEIPLQHERPFPVPLLEGDGTVLLIEDEEQVRNMAKIMLTRLGYTVLEAKDGVEAVEIFQQHPDEIRCVLSDLTMPRMNGWDTLAALRKLSPDTPVVLSSGYDEAQVMAGEHPERPNAFLGKPYQLKELRETIRRVLADKKSFIVR